MPTNQVLFVYMRLLYRIINYQHRISLFDHM